MKRKRKRKLCQNHKQQGHLTLTGIRRQKVTDNFTLSAQLSLKYFTGINVRKIVKHIFIWNLVLEEMEVKLNIEECVCKFLILFQMKIIENNNGHYMTVFLHT